MRIAWLSPLSASSAIGRVTALLAERMQRTAEIHLWCADRGELHETSVPVVPFDVTEAFVDALRTYDAVLYSFGDHYPFHREVFLMSQRVPGIVILHDYVMHHFFLGYYLEQPGGVDRYFEVMARLYGDEARAAARASFRRGVDRWLISDSSTPLWVTDRVVDYPLFEETLHNATGVVVHSDFLYQRVRRVTDAPVRKIDLPVVPRPPAFLLSREGLGVPPGRALVLTIGHVNPNKLVHEVIAALGQDADLAARVFYAVVGPLPPGSYPEELREAIARRGLGSTVRLMGRATEDELQAWLHHADICVNLRRPVMEGGSASLADQLIAGKPVVVSDAGVYAEAPSDGVLKLEAGREGERIGESLRRLLDDTAFRQNMASRGRAYAESHFQPNDYAAALLEFIDASGGFAAMVRYADRMGATMNRMGIQPGMAIVRTVARESADLFGEPITSPWKPGRDA